MPPMMSQGCFCKVDDLGRLRIRDDFSQDVAGIWQVSPDNTIHAKFARSNSLAIM